MFIEHNTDNNEYICLSCSPVVWQREINADLRALPPRADSIRGIEGFENFWWYIHPGEITGNDGYDNWWDHLLSGTLRLQFKI